MLERRRRCAHDLGQVLGDLLGDDRFLVLAQGCGAALDAVCLGLHACPDRVSLGHSAGADRVRLGLAVESGGSRLGLGLHLECCGGCLGLDARLGRGGLGMEPDLLRLGLGLSNSDVAPRGGEGRLLVCLRVGRLAHVDLELLFLLLGLELGDLRLLLDNGLLGAGLGERPLLRGVLIGPVDLRLEPGLLDLRVAG